MRIGPDGIAGAAVSTGGAARCCGAAWSWFAATGSRREIVVAETTVAAPGTARCRYRGGGVVGRTRTSTA
jgi:hypothetical protein